MSYQPKTGQKCSCRRGIERDNCPTCEGTGWVIDFKAIRKALLNAQPTKADDLRARTDLLSEEPS